VRGGDRFAARWNDELQLGQAPPAELGDERADALEEPFIRRDGGRADRDAARTRRRALHDLLDARHEPPITVDYERELEQVAGHRFLQQWLATRRTDRFRPATASACVVVCTVSMRGGRATPSSAACSRAFTTTG